MCVTATLVDGVVLARSGFHHSLNYRSAVVFGTATAVVDAEEKSAALDAIVEHLVPGRTSHIRPMSDVDLKSTLVVALPITEASAKVRTGPPVDEPDDYALPIWAGVVPLTTRFGPPDPDPDRQADIAVPDHVADYQGPA